MDPVRCPECGSTVPRGQFCADCGAYLTPRRGATPAWLRPGAFCVAPDESLLRPSVAMLLPQVPRAAPRPFTAGLVVMVLTMAILVELYRPRAIITVAALGLPFLLVMCWRRAGVLQRRPRWAVVTTVVLAVGLAVGWVLMTGDLITTLALSPFDAGTAGRRVLRDGLGIAEGGTLLMLAPAVIVRLLWRSPRNPLDGFVIGVLSALVFTATSTLTRLAPQLVMAPLSRDEHVHGLFFAAAVRGLTIPVAAACLGGLIGCLLWFERPEKSVRGAGSRPIVVLAILSIAALGLYAFMGRSDSERAPELALLVEYVGMALFALLALRLGMQLALLHGCRRAPMGEPVDCLYCRTTVPESTFCPACGVAACVRSGPSGGEHPVTAAEQGSAWRVPVTWLAGMTALYGVFIGVPALTVRPPPRYECPPACGSPPTGKPVSANPRFTAPDGSFSVAYPAPGTAYTLKIDDQGVTATLVVGDGGKMRLTSEPAAGRTAQDIADAFVTRTFPTAAKAFEIPNAMVGFQPGYGEVADILPLGFGTGSDRLRSVVVVAIKNDLALIAATVGPYHEFGPDFGPGRPSPTNLQIAEDMGRYVNSFRWRGDPPG